MLKFLTINDVHLADYPPESRVDEDYAGTLLAKLDQVAKVSKVIGAKAVLNAGDLFHIKTASRNSHALIQRVSKVMADMSLVLSIAGNHDLSHDRLESLSKQPLGDLFETKVTKHIHLAPELFSDGVDDPPVKVVGLSFVSELEKYARHPSFDHKGPVVALLHCAASPSGGDFHGDKVYSYRELKQLFPEVSVFVIGHLHYYTGIHQVEGSWFMNLGAISRNSIHQDNLNRRVYAGLIEISDHNISCKQIALRTLPSEHILSVEKHNKLKEERAMIEAFVETLKSETVEPKGTDAIHSFLAKEAVPDKVKQKALALLEEAGLNQP